MEGDGREGIFTILININRKTWIINMVLVKNKKGGSFYFNKKSLELIEFR